MPKGLLSEAEVEAGSLVLLSPSLLVFDDVEAIVSL